jgi:hypothetical protein
MAKRKRQTWTKKDNAELKAHSKSRIPVAKISKSDEKNGWSIKAESSDFRNWVGSSSLIDD